MLPFVNLPLVDLSITAPLMLPVMYYAFQSSGFFIAQHWRYWTGLAVLIWMGMLLGFLFDGPWIGGREFEIAEISHLVDYAYWFLVMLTTAYVASHIEVQRHLVRALGWSVLLLALLRCFEAAAFGKIGAWTGTIFTGQNTYGILFSTFTPFLFPGLLSHQVGRNMLSLCGLIVVFLASALNGSRGSWICIGVGYIVFALLNSVTRPNTIWKMLLPLLLGSLALITLLTTVPSAREKVLSRFYTFNNLEDDKSYMNRQVLNQRHLRLFASSPWVGVGPVQIKQKHVPLDMPGLLSYKTDADLMRRSAHNSYLGLLAQGGLVTFVPFALLLSSLSISGVRAAIVLVRRGELWAPAVFGAFVAMSIHFWALSGLNGTHGWFIYGLVIAMVVQARRLTSTNARPVLQAPAPVLLQRPSAGQTVRERAAD